MYQVDTQKCIFQRYSKGFIMYQVDQLCLILDIRLKICQLFSSIILKPIAQKVKSYIKDTNDFLRKLDALPSLPEDIILCTIDVMGLYPQYLS